MTLHVEQLALPEVRVLSPKRFSDKRGFFSEVYNREAFEAAGIPGNWVQDNHSLSINKGVLRGLHFQRPPHDQAKLVRVPKGKVFDVAVDLRKGSPRYGKWAGCVLSEENWSQIFIPRGFAHGFLTLEPNTEVLYKVDAYYAPEADAGVRWEDPDIAIEWPGEVRILAEKDRKLPFLADLDSPFLYDD